MSLEDHVPSFELCRKWKEIGGRQDTIFVFCPMYNDTHDIISYTLEDRLIIQNPKLKEDMIAAPLEGELMEWMKEDIACISWNNADEWVTEVINDGGLSVSYYRNKSLPNALMQMAIWREGNK